MDLPPGDTVRPLPVAVADEVLDDLAERVRRTRWSDGITGAGWSHGTDLTYLRELAAYWVDGFAVTVGEAGGHERAAIAALTAEARDAEDLGHQRVDVVGALVGAISLVVHGVGEAVAR